MLRWLRASYHSQGKEGVVVDGNMITGRGPGWAVEFGLAILAHVKGQEIAYKVKAGLML